ncbi:conjugal transfer protein TraB [Streptomyces sp. NPDC093223]|uniref:conjugal transfer protein TraB n=1 Tax=Streptomyces sp. NPDC093223 TaxID=3366033 RepID=UPI00381D3B02
MSDLEPRGAHPPNSTPVPADDDNRYKAVQEKLGALAHALDGAGGELESLVRSIKENAQFADDVAADIAAAGLDPTHVDLATHVGAALGGAGRQVHKLQRTAQETADLAYNARSTHRRLYEGLDELRSNRREKTPKPGFFDR